jgi:succinylglutamate desuccinylase
MKKILLLGSQHGNELLGDALYAHIRTHRRDLLPFVTFKIGNPRAKKLRVRFIESDLNRSYAGTGKTYEERRAKRLLRFIKQGNFDLVLDLHTTTVDQPPCLIVPRLNGQILPFLQACSIKRLVHMRHEFNVTALTGACPVAVAVEVNHQSLNEALMTRLCDDITRYLKSMPLPLERTVFEVNDLLAKNEMSEEEAVKLRNFERCKHGFAPVLVGENSYKKHTAYLGFKAYKVYQTAL